MSIAPTLIQEARAGDQQAFMQLLEPELPGAFRLAAAMLRNPTEAEDAVQEAALKAWRSFARFRRDADLRPWLLTIVANECRNRRRDRWLSVLGARDWRDEPSASDAALDPAASDLRRALHRLPHDQRLVLVLRFYLDLSFEEVGRTLGISTKAAKSRTYRALERLRLSPEVLSDE